jgi:hypothetical protein
VRKRSTLPLALTATAALGLGLTLPTSAQAADDSAWCSSGASAPCIESVTRDGVPVGPTSPDWDVWLSHHTGGGSSDISFTIAPVDGPGGLIDMGATERSRRWSVRVNTGSTVPRVTSTFGRDVVVTRATHGGGHRVTITGNPVRITDNDECAVGTWPWVCPHRATDESLGYFSGWVTDYGTWDDADQREAMHGLDYSSNIAVGSLPPEITVDPATGANRLLLRLANQHEFPDGSLFRGNVHVRIPNSLLSGIYGVDDPAALTTSGVEATVGSGSVAVTQEAGDTAMLVDAEGITFSARTLRIERGDVRPTRPKKATGKRLSWHRARIGYKKARSRGSKVTGYVVRCKPIGKRGGVIKVHDRAPRTRIDRLAINTGYKCKVRAKSKAGVGAWSRTVRVKARTSPRR